MFILKGIVKIDTVEKTKNTKGQIISRRVLYLHPENSISTVKIISSDEILEIEKVGSLVNSDIIVYSFDLNYEGKGLIIDYYEEVSDLD